MSNHEPVKRYAMPILPDGRLAAPVEAERGCWMQYDDYDRDIKALEERIEELEGADSQWCETLRMQKMAFAAMRNDLNEIFGDMASDESSLRNGPELAAECEDIVCSAQKVAQRIAKQTVTITRLTTFCDEFVWGEENPREYQTLHERYVLLQDLLREFSCYLDRLPKNEDTQILASKLHVAHKEKA